MPPDILEKYTILPQAVVNYVPVSSQGFAISSLRMGHTQPHFRSPDCAVWPCEEAQNDIPDQAGENILLFSRTIKGAYFYQKS